jgi:hypothetical protein
MQLRSMLLTGGAALALVASGTAAGAAIAAGPVDSQGVIHGCWTNAAINGTHVFVLQDAGTTCPKGTTAVSWNQTGPAGPAGPVGPAGATGATGAPGPGGQVGPAGPAGPAGENGNTVLNGSGPPASSLGNDGDFYIDTAADVLYGPKASGTWPATGTSLAGNPGPAGPAGPAGPPGPAGPAGNSDIYSGVVQMFSGSNGSNADCTFVSSAGPSPALAVSGSGPVSCQISGAGLTPGYAPVVSETITPVEIDTLGSSDFDVFAPDLGQGDNETLFTYIVVVTS